MLVAARYSRQQATKGGRILLLLLKLLFHTPKVDFIALAGLLSTSQRPSPGLTGKSRVYLSPPDGLYEELEFCSYGRPGPSHLNDSPLGHAEEMGHRS